MPFTVTASARDAAGNPIGDYNAPATWSNLDGGLAPAAPADFVNGISTTTDTIDHRPTTRGSRFESGGVSGHSEPFEVLGPASLDVHFVDPMEAGVPFTVTVFARDAAGKKMTTYQGTATWSDLSGTLSPAAPARFVNGVSTTEATITQAFHNDRLMVRSGGAQERTGPFDVRGPVASIVVTLPPSSAAKARGRAHVYTLAGVFTLKATALDAAGNLVSGYDGPASWSSLDGVLSPAAPNPFVHGVSTTQATIPVALS